MDSRPPLESFFKSPLQREYIRPPLDTFFKSSKEKKLQKGDKGDKPTKQEILEVAKPVLDKELSEERLQSIIFPLIPPPIPGKRGKKGEKPSETELLMLIQPLIPEVEDGVTPSIEELEAIILPLLPDAVELDTPKEIIEKINKSRGEKIKRSKIDGLDEIEGKIEGNRRQLQNFVSLGGSRSTIIKNNGVLVGTGINTINLIGATIAKVGDGSEINVTFSGSGGISVIAVSGTKDDSNVTFTAPSQPTLLNINGPFYQQTGGAITWSYSGDTITLSSAVGTGGSIYGI